MVGRGESTGDRQRDKCSKVTTNHGIIIPRRQPKGWVVWFVDAPQDLIWVHWQKPSAERFGAVQD